MIDRRKLLELGLFAGAAVVAPGAALAKAHRRAAMHHAAARHGAAGHAGGRLIQASRNAPLPDPALPRRLAVYNLHTDEHIDAVYWERGAYVPDALDAVNHVLRDFRTGEVRVIEPRLLDVLSDLHAATEARGPFQLISGYRSAQTNQMLREQSAEVAQQSFHVQGKAMDLYLDDIDLARLRGAAMDLSRGGVGYYPQSKFIHVDVGPVRHWQGV